MADAVLAKDANANSIEITAPAVLTPGEILQLPDGRAARYAGDEACASGDIVTMITGGHHTVTKTASVVILDGDQLYWDRSANTATPLKAVTGADFPLGTAVGDAASAAATVVVDLNKRPVYAIDIMRDPTDTTIVLTAGTAALTMQPGYAKLAFSATAEAQKVDIMSKQSVPVTIPFIVEGTFCIADNGDATAPDFNIGIANGTHATDADSITESVFLHLDGNDLNLDAESDDGTTEVAATDTTIDLVEGTYVDFRMDCRDLTDIQIYVDAVLVLTASVFALDAATGPMKLLAHMEKTSDDSPGEMRVSHLAIRTTDVE